MKSTWIRVSLRAARWMDVDGQLSWAFLHKGVLTNHVTI